MILKVVKYFFVGGTTAIVDVGLFFLLVKVFEFNYLLIGFLTFIIATFVNYHLSIKFVFKSGKRFKKYQEIILIYFVSAFSLILNLLLLFTFHELLIFDVFISKLLVTALLFLFNYSVRKYLIF